ncbi:MAG: DUF116 domain-containing protein [candidate division Zixibacteria bacterium]|nr:DUF116 domain-containing protein [candidate division Zixibacteria bacterium]
MASEQKAKKRGRKLGDEWANWDGQVVQNISTDTDPGVFIGLSIATILAILGLTALFGWLIYPRLNQLGNIYGEVFIVVYFSLAIVLTIWLGLFIWGFVTKRPFLSGLIIVPKLVNLLLDFSIKIGKLFGISRDRLVNSFLKLHNLILSSKAKKVRPEKILILLPRCLTRDMNKALRGIRDKYGVLVAMAEGGGEARNKIKETKPGIIIAVACERDLLTGFVDINPHIPVIGFPNVRPCGPCKDTEVDLKSIEDTVKRYLIAAKEE